MQGSEPFTANLTAEIAYYVYIILGLDFDSFSLKGGDTYFQRALNIVNNAPDSRDINGWKAFDGIRNRYWLIENLTNNKYNLIHDAYYSYYRSGLDQLYDKETDGRTAVLSALNMLNNINTESPNTMIMQFFFQGKRMKYPGFFRNPLLMKNPGRWTCSPGWISRMPININRTFNDKDDHRISGHSSICSRLRG